jgi:hypothetical protein
MVTNKVVAGEGKSSMHYFGRIADDYLKRDFKSDRPFQKLVSDLTLFQVGQTKVYLSPLIDLYNGEVIS